MCEHYAARASKCAATKSIASSVAGDRSGVAGSTQRSSATSGLRDRRDTGASAADLAAVMDAVGTRDMRPSTPRSHCIGVVLSLGPAGTVEELAEMPWLEKSAARCCDVAPDTGPQRSCAEQAGPLPTPEVWREDGTGSGQGSCSGGDMTRPRRSPRWCVSAIDARAVRGWRVERKETGDMVSSQGSGVARLLA